MNDENLRAGKKTQFKSGEQAARNGKKGAETKKRIAARRKVLQALLKEGLMLRLKELPDDLQEGIMKAAKINDDTLTVGHAVWESLIIRACSGNAKMMKMLLDLSGITPDAKLKSQDTKLNDLEIKQRRKALKAGIEETSADGKTTMEQLVDSIHTACEERKKQHSGEDDT